MVGAGEWAEFIDELSRWRHANRVVEFWWRDDDACRPDPALDRLYALAARTGIPLALAAVPSAVAALFGSMVDATLDTVGPVAE